MTRNGSPIGDPAGRMTAEAAAEVIERLADAADLTGAGSGHLLRRGFTTAARPCRSTAARSRGPGRLPDQLLVQQVRRQLDRPDLFNRLNRCSHIAHQVLLP